MNENYLPKFDGVPDGLRFSRNVREGYIRGWGLQYGNLRDKVRADPLYREAASLAAGRTVVSEDNRMNIYLILKFFLGGVPAGHIFEFGSYRGGNAIFMAHVAKQLHPGMRVYALDTFAGMPDTDHSVDAHRAGDFSDVDLAELRRFAEKKRLDNLEFVQGLFEDTAPALLARVGKVALAHIDCDIHSAVVSSYEMVKPHMVEGGYIVFDDATYSSCIGATEAVETLLVRRDGLNSEQIFPQFVFRAHFGAGAETPR